LTGKKQRRDAIEKQMATAGFWNDQEKAQQVVAELKRITAILKPFAELSGAGDDVQALVELADEDDSGASERELETELDRVEKRLAALELQAMLSGPNDEKNAFVTIQAGEGGTEACDWSNMLLRLYLRWAEEHDYQTELLEVSGGEEAGVRSATVAIRGEYAYGYLKGETGVHRLVRISPFDAASRRHTSFAAVDVTPEIEDDIEIDIRDEDLRVDTYRASGAGGQHVNKTSSAVRITHLPTGLVVQCQNERSQHKNRRMALSMLRARLYRVEEEKREAEIAKHYDAKGKIGFGSQIRSYVLQPYQLVKDLRTDEQTGNVTAVLDGDIDRFIEAYLRKSIGAAT
jgi:peptide chain release factor 2